MKRIYIYCEGYAEESFVNNLLYDYFLSKEILVRPIICITKRTSVKKFKGGISNFDKFSKELKNICKYHDNEIVTTMIDYYGLPDDFPNVNLDEIDVYKKIAQMEKSLEESLCMQNFKAYISLHEFESLLYSEPKAFSLLGSSIESSIEKIKLDFKNNPEAINNSKETAPSKRILNIVTNYSKVSDGTKIAKEIGIEKIMLECRHFKEWIDRLQ